MLSDPGGRKRDSLKEDEVSSGLHEKEPNGVIGKATPLKLTKERREIKGQLKDLDLIDWFEIHFAEVGDYSIVVRPSKGLDVSLFLPGQSYGFDVGKLGGKEMILATHTQQIRFAVKREGKSEGDYTIESLKTLKLDGAEKEPNNDVGHANTLDLEMGMTAQITQRGDLDVFKLRSERSWDLQVTGDKADVFSFKFCRDDALKQCSRLYSFEGRTLKIPAFHTQSQTLFLVVASLHPTQPYRIHGINRPEKTSYLEEREPNDSFPMEIFSKEGKVEIQGFLKEENDVDVFHVAEWEGFYYTMESLDSNLSLVDLKGREVVGKFTSCGMKGVEEFGLKVGKRIGLATKDTPDYRIEVFANDTVSGFEGEPNDLLQDANDVVDTVMGEIRPGDIDYYRVHVQAGQQPQVHVENLSGSPLHVSVVDEEGLDLIGDSAIAAKKSKRIKIGFPEGQYFVRVYGANLVDGRDTNKSNQKGDCRPYRLRLQNQ